MKNIVFACLLSALLFQSSNAQPNVIAWGGGTGNHQVTTVPPDLTNAIAVSCNYVEAVGLQENGILRAWEIPFHPQQ